MSKKTIIHLASFIFMVCSFQFFHTTVQTANTELALFEKIPSVIPPGAKLLIFENRDKFVY